MLKTLYSRLTSLNLGLWLLTGVMLALAAGSFSRGSSESGGLNDMPLFVWLQHAPISFSWWLWICLALIAVLCLNTLCCSIEALRRKGRSIAPHLMHLGFLLIVVAHFSSAYGGMKQVLQLGEGGGVAFPDGEMVRVEAIAMDIGPMGMPSGYRAALKLENGRVQTIEPNSPLFHRGYGIYLKNVDYAPAPVALLEIHKEPGAPWALIGAIFFTIGNVMLLARRSGR